MIKYQDFAPRITKRGTFGGAAKYESFSDVVSVANQWIENSTIQVMNVETVVLPDSLESTSDGVYGVAILQRRRYANGNGFYPVMVSQGLTINCFQCVRVWYRK
jgi:hypothetical protein